MLPSLHPSHLPVVVAKGLLHVLGRAILLGVVLVLSSVVLVVHVLGVLYIVTSQLDGSGIPERGCRETYTLSLTLDLLTVHPVLTLGFEQLVGLCACETS